jgi:hypothetical protein
MVVSIKWRKGVRMRVLVLRVMETASEKRYRLVIFGHVEFLSIGLSVHLVLYTYYMFLFLTVRKKTA